ISLKLEVDTSEFEQKLEMLREKVGQLTSDTVIVYVNGYPSKTQAEEIRNRVKEELPMLKHIAVLPNDLALTFIYPQLK
ncbi:hypothetical protein JBE27_50685, partial [Streptomyces albiflaviniger]|nr:hypothetical protein [Streptomyces albiflaviniger]